jgi:hypothetical protein
MFGFDDEELGALLELARPIYPAELRTEFIREVAEACAGEMRGPGRLHRVAVEVQRRFISGLQRAAERESLPRYAWNRRSQAGGKTAPLHED